MKRILLIDNAYLEHIASMRLDYRKVAEHFEVEQTIVYDCVQDGSTKARFIDALRYLPGFTVKLGKIQEHPSGSYHTTNPGVYVPPVQKMVDVMLALDIVKASQRFDNVIVLTGDCDFVPAFQEAQNNLCMVTLVHMDKVDQELVMAANQTVLFGLKIQEKCRLEKVA